MSKNFSGTQVGAEPGLGHDVVGEPEPGPGGDDRVAAVGDVRERAAVDQRRVALERLDEVRHERVLEQDGHGARRLQVGRGHRPPVARVGHDDAAEPGLQVGKVAGEAEDRHDLRGDRDVEAVLAREAVAGAAEPETIWRSALSFMSSARRQTTRRWSMPSALPQ
jgi:hypothetical protein